MHISSNITFHSDSDDYFDYELPENNFLSFDIPNQNEQNTFGTTNSLTPCNLREWALKYQISHTALNDLLKLIVPTHQ